MAPLYQPRLIVAAPANPAAGGLGRGSLVHRLLERLDGLHAGGLAVDGGHGEAQAREMAVRVDEARQQGAAA
jgi:hypothetical protein